MTVLYETVFCIMGNGLTVASAYHNHEIEECKLIIIYYVGCLLNCKLQTTKEPHKHNDIF